MCLCVHIYTHTHTHKFCMHASIAHQHLRNSQGQDKNKVPKKSHTHCPYTKADASPSYTCCETQNCGNIMQERWSNPRSRPKCYKYFISITTMPEKDEHFSASKPDNIFLSRDVYETARDPHNYACSHTRDKGKGCNNVFKSVNSLLPSRSNGIV